LDEGVSPLNAEIQSARVKSAPFHHLPDDCTSRLQKGRCVLLLLLELGELNVADSKQTAPPDVCRRPDRSIEVFFLPMVPNSDIVPTYLVI